MVIIIMIITISTSKRGGEGLASILKNKLYPGLNLNNNQ